MLGETGFLIFVMTVLAEIMVLKLLYITRFSNLAAMNENFISRFIILQNALFCSLLMGVRAFTGEPMHGWVCGKVLTGFYKNVNIW